MSRALGTLYRFTMTVYGPGLHIAFAAFWYLALQGTLVLLHPGARSWHLGLDTWLAVLSNFLVLFYLRAVDEIKDYDYDRVYNPDRPLVTGMVTTTDLAWYLGGTAVLVVAVNIHRPWQLLTLVALDLAYGLALLGVERISRLIRDNMYVNLLVTYPVNIALSVYTYWIFLVRHGQSWSARGLLLIAAFACAFLYYEAARKTLWPREEDREARLYSNIVGGTASALMGLAMACGASGLVLYLVAPWTRAGALAVAGWLQLLPLLTALWGVGGFLAKQGAAEPARRKANMKLSGLLFLVTFYLGLFALALVSGAGKIALR